MILLIDNYDSFTYNLYQSLAAYDEVCVRRNDQITLENIKTLSPNKIVLSPGPGIPSDAGICLEVVTLCAEQGLPLLGVCLGHQAIVEAFGGRVVIAGHPVHGKAADIQHDGVAIFEALPQPFCAGRYHSLHAPQADIPACLHITATTQEGMVMGVQHRELPIYGVQFHPESILTPCGDQLLKNFMQLEVVCAAS